MKLSNELEKWNTYYLLNDDIIVKKSVMLSLMDFFDTFSIPKICLLCMHYKFYGLYNFLLLSKENILEDELFLNIHNEYEEVYFNEYFSTLPDSLIFKSLEIKDEILNMFENEYQSVVYILHKKPLVKYFCEKNPNFLNKKFNSGNYPINIASFFMEFCELYDIDKVKLILNNLKEYGFNFNVIPTNSRKSLLETMECLYEMHKNEESNISKNFEYVVNFIKAL